jgi:hypothetical protein
VAKAKSHDRALEKRASQETAERIETRKEIREVNRRMPTKSVRRQKVRAENQGRTAKEIQGRSSPPPVRQQEVQAEGKNRPERKKQREGGELRLEQRNKSRFQAEGSHFGKDRGERGQSRIRDFSGRKQDRRNPSLIQRAVK